MDIMDKRKLQFSIIIPVYNAEKFIEECIESILNQTFNNFEVLCINDGSTDNSLEILEKYSKLDNRIKVLTQTNQGSSAARNLGLKNAQGEYILFCDADDKFKPNLCSVVAAVALKENKDVIAYGHEKYIDGVLEESDHKIITSLKKYNKLTHWLDLQVYIWEKAFKRSFIEKHNIQFPIGIKNAEDVIFCLLTYFFGAEYSLIEEALYEYTKERNGRSTFTNPNGIKNDTDAFNLFIKTEIFNNLSSKMKREVTNFFIGGSVLYYKTLKETEHKEKLLADLKRLYSIVLSMFPLIDCLKMKSFRRIHKLIFKETHKKLFENFNIITTPTTKTLVVCGTKFTVKRSPKRKVKK